MTIQVTGKNIEVGNALQTYLVDRTRSVLEKYIGREISGHLRVAKERGRFYVSCSIRLKTGLLLEAQGESHDAYASADAALERLDKRVRRYKRRLKDHHSLHAQTSTIDHTVQTTKQETEECESLCDSLIIAETKRSVSSLNVSEAAMQLDLTEEPFFVFRNAANGSTNIVYKRSDGNIGWIDPSDPVA